MKKINKISLFAKSIFILISLFFLFGIYLSIPVLFNYKSIENIIEKRFYTDFNINLNINGDIKYQLLPKPHLLISNSSLSIDKDSKESMSIDIDQLKVYLNSNNLYPKTKLNFEKLEIKQNNFLLKEKEYRILRNFFHTSEGKPIHIKKSKIFLLDDQNETLIISPLEKMVFSTSETDNFKKININGNIFDLDFKSRWKKEFNSKFESQIEIDLRDPNIFIKNILNYDNSTELQGSSIFKFLNHIIEINYQLKNNMIYIKSPANNNNIKIETKIELKPFYLNSNFTLSRQNLNFLIDELVFSILNLNSELVGNLNGDFKLSLINIEHEILKDGYLSFNVNEKSINLNKVILNLSDIGIIKSEISYDEEEGEIIFNSSNILTIENYRNFAKKFQLKQRKVSDLKKISFKIKKNITTGIISIFDININKSDDTDLSLVEKSYNIKNLQELKLIVKKIINN